MPEARSTRDRLGDAGFLIRNLVHPAGQPVGAQSGIRTARGMILTRCAESRVGLTRRGAGMALHKRQVTLATVRVNALKTTLP